jgi:ABC-type polar amino acid transport system ATPase subunit
MFEAINIHKSHGGGAILHGVNVQVEPGRITVLVGPSGGGKTTLLRALTFLDPPDEGAIIVDENSYLFGTKKPVSPNPWPKVTAVFQQLFLWPHLTMRRNITLPFESNSKPYDRDMLQKLIDQFDMAPFIDRYPNQASLGQRQRVALVRALMLQPRYLFLDEVTSSLDIEQIAVVIECLQELRAQGVGIFMITHLLRFALESADHVYFLDHGKVVESGGLELLKHPKSERMQRFLAAALMAS